MAREGRLGPEARLARLVLSGMHGRALDSMPHRDCVVGRALLSRAEKLRVDVQRKSALAGERQVNQPPTRARETPTWVADLHELGLELCGREGVPLPVLVSLVLRMGLGDDPRLVGAR